MEDVERAEGDDGARHGGILAVPTAVRQESTAMDRHRGSAAPMITARPRRRRAASRRAAPDAHASPSGCWCSPPSSTSLTLDQDGFLGFVNAGAEASMVGAIADWFAVTALFKHPLGLPIPHTALIPKRKDELGRGLEEFVGENFLQEEIIRDRVARGDDLAAAGRLARRARATPGGWSTRSPRSRRSRWRRSATSTSRAGARRADPAVPRGADRAAARRPARRGARATTCTTGWSTSPSRSCTAGWSRTPTRSPRCSSERAPWWAPPRLNEAVTAPDPRRAGPLGRRHPRRPAAPRPAGARLGAAPSSPTTCCHDPETQARAEALKERLLDHPQVDPRRRSRCGTRCAAALHRLAAGPATAPSARGC